MAKPRIIVADTDSSYIMPLQLRFVEEFFDKIDLEIITDRDYFASLFASPQKADILIVSEELYDSSLQRHNIGNIFLMTEQYQEGQTDELNVNRIFKYTSIKEIFNEIIGKSATVFRVDVGKQAGSQIVVVYSAAGGVGKTTVALGMAICLTQNYKRVLYINASYLQSFQRMLGNQAVISTADAYSKLAKSTESVYSDIRHVLRKEIFTYLPPFKASLMSLGLKYSIYEKIATSAKRSNDFDFIIVDADSAFDDEKAALIDAADKVVIVTTQAASSVYATNALVSNINGIDSDKYVFICNNFESEKDNAIVAAQTMPQFVVSEYIDHIPHYDSLKAEDLANSGGIKKASFLVL